MKFVPKNFKKLTYLLVLFVDLIYSKIIGITTNKKILKIEINWTHVIDR